MILKGINTIMDISSVFGTNPENLLSLPSADDNDDFNDDEVYYVLLYCSQYYS